MVPTEVSTSDAEKRRAAEKAVEYVKAGMVVGLGTGSTSLYAIKRLGKLVRDGLDIIGIPTSLDTEKVARASGVKLSTLEEHPSIDVTIDGADEIDPALDLVKGKGGALLREKLVASASKTVIIIADSSKLVHRLGAVPLPVEVLPFGWKVTAQALAGMGCVPDLRAGYTTDNGNYVLDCGFDELAPELERTLNAVPGVMENGLFIGLADLVIIGEREGTRLFSR